MKEGDYRVFQFTALALLILYFGQALFIPLVYSGFIALFLYPFCKRLENKGVKRIFAIALGMTMVSCVMLGLAAAVYYQYRLFVTDLPQIITKLEPLRISIADWLQKLPGWQTGNTDNLPQSLAKFLGQDLGSLLKSGIDNSVTLIFNAILIPIYAVLILNYRERLLGFIVLLAGNQNSQRIHIIAVKTIQSYASYIKGMVQVYLIVGVLNSIGLLLLGVKYAILFGMITAVMTIIPYLGIIISSLLPLSMSLLTTGSFYYPLGVIVVFSIVQYLEGNFIYPYIVGKRMNVNVLVSIVSVIAGGFFWGVSGMVLVLPLVGVLKIVADQVESWKALSFLLGDKDLP